MCVWLFEREWVGFAGERGECGGEFGELCAGVDAGAVVGVVVVAGVGAGYGVAEVAFDPGEGGVPKPVGGHALHGCPWQVVADSAP